MCGITGIFNFGSKRPINPELLQKMMDLIIHRGPDGEGKYIKDNVGLGHRRLSIIDLTSGDQPIFNEDETIAVVFNGEIFNYVELRDRLISLGHIFKTTSDTEVIVHAYEEFGYPAFLSELNGQFAISLYDDSKKKLILARDRVGIRPLFYSLLNNGQEIIFSSEMKSLHSHPEVDSNFDYKGLNEIFSLWVNIPPRTIFKGIKELPPGHAMEISHEHGIKTYQYWRHEFPEASYTSKPERPLQFYQKELEELLYDSITLRLRSDVPVGTYLSGGLDSSYITSMVKKHHKNELSSFSVAFTDQNYDESEYQKRMVEHLGTDHRIIKVTPETIGESFSDAVYFAERPMIRTAPSPMLKLSGLVRENKFKVVLTGEGADEVFGGYNIFKEDKVRRFWAKFPNSNLRPKLLTKLYPYLGDGKGANPFWQNFFKKGLTETDHPFYSHLIRWSNTSYVKRFFNKEIREHFNEEEILENLKSYVHPDMMKWHPLSRSQYLESILFMPGNLLSSQGDRMLMGNSVEGRFPFLDHRIIEFAAKIPAIYKINGLNEKFILKKVAEPLLPKSISNREKRPYRAPIASCFMGNDLNLSQQMFSDEKIREFNLFDEKSISKLKIKLNQGIISRGVSARDDMACAAIISTQLLKHYYL
jgi:asparagine synthase (glutamine-hydrolysing)